VTTDPDVRTVSAGVGSRGDGRAVDGDDCGRQREPGATGGNVGAGDET
jgi:hypothetical protein